MFKLLLCVFTLGCGTALGNTMPCPPMVINGQYIGGNALKCNRSAPVFQPVQPVSNLVRPYPTYLDANGQPIGIPYGIRPPVSTKPAVPPATPVEGVCIPGGDLTEQLIEIVNNLLVNVKIVDDGVPVYLRDGQLVVNPKYLDDIKKKKNANNKDSFFCPVDSATRACHSSLLYRSGASPVVCQSDSQCKDNDGFLRLCCFDYCLQEKVCKPALARTM